MVLNVQKEADEECHDYLISRLFNRKTLKDFERTGANEAAQIILVFKLF